MRETMQNGKINPVGSSTATGNQRPIFWHRHKNRIIICGIVLAIVVIAAILWFILSAGGQKTVKTGNIEINDGQKIAVVKEYAGKIYLRADRPTVKIGDTLTMDVLLDTRGTNVSAAEIKIYYDPSKVEFIGWQNNESVFSLKVIEETETNYISFVRGEPGDGNANDDDDGFTGSDGLVARAMWQAKSFGMAEFNFDRSATKVAVDDGMASLMSLEFEDLELATGN